MDKAEESEDEESENEPEEDLDEMDAILRDPDFKNMSDSEGDDLPLFDDLSEDEKSGDDEGTYRAKEKRSKKAKVTQVGLFDFIGSPLVLLCGTKFNFDLYCYYDFCK